LARYLINIRLSGVMAESQECGPESVCAWRRYCIGQRGRSAEGPCFGDQPKKLGGNKQVGFQRFRDSSVLCLWCWHTPRFLARFAYAIVGARQVSADAVPSLGRAACNRPSICAEEHTPIENRRARFTKPAKEWRKLPPPQWRRQYWQHQ
jgi:hypothetical protein